MASTRTVDTTVAEALTARLLEGGLGDPSLGPRDAALALAAVRHALGQQGPLRDLSPEDVAWQLDAFRVLTP